MSEINEQCVYQCGPYKGYFGRAEYDAEADLFHGEVAGTRNVITFQGRTHGELGAAFQESVDDYLAFCAERDELEVRETYAAQRERSAKPVGTILNSTRTTTCGVEAILKSSLALQFLRVLCDLLFNHQDCEQKVAKDAKEEIEGIRRVAASMLGVFQGQ